MRIFLLFLLWFGPVWAGEVVDTLPRGVLFEQSKASAIVKGRGAFIEDMASNPLYGGLTADFFGEASGPPFTEADHKAAQALECEANDAANEHKEDALAIKLMNIVHAWHKKNLQNPLKPAMIEDEKHHVENVANRLSACGDTAYALRYLLNKAGFATRVVRVADKLNLPSNIGHLKGADFPASHVMLEYFSIARKKWLMLEPLIDFAPQHSAFELYSTPAMMQELNKRHGQNYYNQEGGLSLLLPDPDFYNQLEILWQVNP